MATTANSIITPQAPCAHFASLTAATALTSRGPITGTTGLTVLAPTSTNGKKINSIQVKGSSTAQTTTQAQTVYVWQFDGTTSWLVDEISIVAIVPSTTVASYQEKRYYSEWIVPSTHSVYVSSSVNTAANLTALTVSLLGGDL